MKKFSRKFLTLTIALFICTGPLPTNAYAANITNSSIVHAESAIITPYSAVIDWRYKVENGKLYRRLYDYSIGEWIGEWELIP